MQIAIKTDGASRGNPGPAAYGYVIYRDGKIFQKEGKTLGVTTNNIAEYTALKEALFFLAESGIVEEVDELLIQADSQLMIRQLLGQYKVKHPGIKEIYTQINKLLEEYSNVRFEHIRREFNKEADSLCNMALDGLI